MVSRLTHEIKKNDKFYIFSIKLSMISLVLFYFEFEAVRFEDEKQIKHKNTSLLYQREINHRVEFLFPV